MTNVIRKITPAQSKALAWLTSNGGIGTFDQAGQRITANGITLNYNREVWVGLRDAGRIKFYNDGPSATPFGAVRLIDKEKAK